MGTTEGSRSVALFGYIQYAGGLCRVSIDGGTIRESHVSLRVVPDITKIY